ncbi:hypothetical protein B0H17DRAFT_1066953 [Mycena rosella]|uniref:DUF6534 domain-containing protein n=1 Tax=Mycena rosella TaxID=1033263 RepID=A0AAD7GDJ5_MYCRO|nr:hypothetical protein B0H17DRAFT_1066953 [Mycena rosella]
MIMGALLVGTWASSVLYTVEVMQAAYYYRHFKHDNWTLKLLVSSVIAIDSVSMIANYASVYLYTITHWGDLAYLQNQYWFDPLYIFATGVVTALVQSFLTARYWALCAFISLCRGPAPNLVLEPETNSSPHFILFIMVATGGVFASGITIAIFPEYANRRKLIIPATVTWLIAEAVTDISIALALLLEFRKVKTSFKETRSLLNGLVAQTIQTGTAGASIALAVLVAYLANPDSNGGSRGIAYCLGRVYCITLLANLNSRNPGKTWSGGAHLRRGNQERSEGGDEYGGIRGFLVRALLRLTLTQCVLQMSTGPLWYSNFQVLNGSVADLAS